MDNKDVLVQNVRNAIKDRALYLALLYRSFSEVLPAEECEKRTREAIFEFGKQRGKMDSQPMSPEKWVDSHIQSGSVDVFLSRIVREEDRCEQQMTFCPLLGAWKELGCDMEERDLLCDIAMEVDRGRAAYHNIRIDLPHRLAKGDPQCSLVLWKESIP